MSKLELEINGNNFFNKSNYKLSILRCSNEHCHPKKAPEKRSRNYYSLHFVTHGKGILESGGSKFNISKGFAFLLYEKENYTYYPDSADPWSYIWIDFTGEEIDDLFSVCGFAKDMPYVKMNNFTEATGYLKQLVESFDASDVQQMLCSGYLLIIMSLLIDSANSASDNYKGHLTKFKYVREALIYINNNYRLDLSIDEIANNARISSSYLMNLFRDEIGIGPTQYINMFRVATACELLKLPDARVNEVAEMVGFKDPLYFARVFTKLKGMSPKQFTKSGLINEDHFKFLKDKNIDYR